MSDTQSAGGGKTLYCSFCGKSQHEVAKLIAGPNVHICDECVSLCNAILNNEAIPTPNPAPNTARPVPPAPQFSFRDLSLGEALHQTGRLSSKEVETFKNKAVAKNASFVDVLLQNGGIDEHTLAAFCSEVFGLPLLDLSIFDPATAADQIFDAQWMRLHSALPLAKSGNRVFVAISDPTNTAALDHIQALTGLPAEPVIVEHAALTRLIERRISSS